MGRAAHNYARNKSFVSVDSPMGLSGVSARALARFDGKQPYRASKDLVGLLRGVP